MGGRASRRPTFANAVCSFLPKIDRSDRSVHLLPPRRPLRPAHRPGRPAGRPTETLANHPIIKTLGGPGALGIAVPAESSDGYRREERNGGRRVFGKYSEGYSEGYSERDLAKESESRRFDRILADKG